jgi:hypothetical protein
MNNHETTPTFFSFTNGGRYLKLNKANNDAIDAGREVSKV